MNSRKWFAMFLVLALTSSALAVSQRQLYGDGSDLEANGLPAIQQHSVFVEIVVEETDDVEQIHQFAAVVGLVKKCKQVRNTFDNAVLWFNDQFLFGNKSKITKNVTPPSALGFNPRAEAGVGDRNGVDEANFTDNNRNNGTELGTGSGDNEGGNPDRDGFVRRQDMRERWGGCYIPDGFVHAIGSDDPYSTGNVTQYDTPLCEDDSAETDNVDCAPEDSDQTSGQQETDANSNGEVKCDNEDTPVNERDDTEDNEGDDSQDACPDGGNQDTTLVDGPDSIEITKDLLDLDESCEGCIFEYVGTFYITDPNNHRWMIDKFVYPVDLANGFSEFDGLGDDQTHCDVYTFDCGLEQERHNDRAEDDGIPEGQFYDNNRTEGDSNPEVCDNEGQKEDPADQPGETQGCDGSNPGGDCDEPNGGQCEDNNENFDNHCYNGDNGECTGTTSDGQEGASFTTKEPLYTVHIQVDPWNPDRQGFPDESIWAYRDGQRRLGMPYPGDPAEGATNPMAQKCKDQATVTDAEMEYDFLEREGAEGQDAAANGDPANPPSGEGREAWADFRRGPVGSTVECSIEYNFLITVDFQAFDDDPLGQDGQGIDEGVEGVRVNSQNEGASDSRDCDGEGADRQQGVRGDDPDNDNDTNKCHPGQGSGESEIIKNYKEHGDGATDNEDAAWQGNSHPHNGKDRCRPEDIDGDGLLEFIAEPDGTADVAQDPPASGQPGYSAPFGYDKPDSPPLSQEQVDRHMEICWMEWTDPTHVHDAVALDLFFSSEAPYFVEQNPYWNNADDPSVKTTGTPPIVSEDCTTVEDDTLPADHHQRMAIEERTPIVCDVDAVDGYHLHDGTQTPRS